MKRCPNYPRCLFTYSRKFTGLLCPHCQVRIPEGGRNVHGINEKKQAKKIKAGEKLGYKNSKTSKVLPKVIQVDNYVYSVAHVVKIRTFVQLAEKAQDIDRCSAKRCEQARILAVKNDEKFYCRHIKTVYEAKSRNKVDTNAEFISKNTAEDRIREERLDIKENISKVFSGVASFAMLKIGNSCYVIK